MTNQGIVIGAGIAAGSARARLERLLARPLTHRGRARPTAGEARAARLMRSEFRGRLMAARARLAGALGAELQAAA